MQRGILFMYSPKNLIYIFTMLECIEKSWIYTKDFDNAYDFVWADNQKNLNAVVSMFIAIGEESKKIEPTLKENSTTTLNWKQIAGIRDKISHDYRGIDEDILWSIIHNDFVVLKNALLDMVKQIKPPKALMNDSLESPYYAHIDYLKEIV